MIAGIRVLLVGLPWVGARRAPAKARRELLHTGHIGWRLRIEIFLTLLVNPTSLRFRRFAVRHRLDLEEQAWHEAPSPEQSSWPPRWR